ncbi:antiviral helicase [Rickenella mellea]|uniref:Antiviral helicase n=1 Tax=Rickenella mellea TaxID=50990 RepID=A0A4Y7QLP8_9AGAM|nr:antiviral helicase [Rickenella mellea]
MKSKEAIYQDVEEQLLIPKDRLPAHWLPSYQIHWTHELNVPSLLKTSPSVPPTTLTFVRTGLDGRVTGYKEVPTVSQSTGLTSTSLDRAPAPIKNFVRGKSGHVPFWPGGLDEIAAIDFDDNVDTPRGLRTIPPGFERGLRTTSLESRFIDDLPEETARNVYADEVDPLVRTFIDIMLHRVYNSPQEPVASDLDVLNDIPSNTESLDVDELLPTSRAHLKPVAAGARKPRRPIVRKRDWAHVVDINKPMKNFHELVPNMAHKYPFELDTFQKEAVYHLEMGDSVFVAAHTSAGKTVVAEYAIALAAKHMTRAIYTSPIKALSNQKFRDFKQTFSSSSVGILTGDVQINPEANCLIMTTEILRSMLYKGADLIRDVEFVIFDEVHYVNDAERGVVWEEVIIMLPEHVSIILLSATVPNTKEFADWVGRTKKKDIYVISTLTRPVPLEHYLYAGRDIYKIVDSKRNFINQGYKEAGEALRRKQDKEREAAGLPPVQRLGARAAAPQRGQRGGTPQRGSTPQRGRATTTARGGFTSSPRTFHQPDKNLYVHLIGHLRKKELLPVVVFTFSKKRCEENAATLTNLDICTSVEKSKVHVVIDQALSRLKGSDKKLPQIGRMRDLLSRGIGIHHGGLLPIVKEVVEILFARGLVKVLFATETFAMGVNMPAKCVVFSGIRKHDGRSFREILPGEYTQMAGRAGRRGLDTTGTVIIIVGDSLPEQTTLNTMMLGTPSKLQSQFRLTYNMILNLLRVEALKVEEMIKRSFSENASQKLLPQHQRDVLEKEDILSKLPKLDCDICSGDINEFYDISNRVVQLNRQLLSIAAGSVHGAKFLSSGRVVVLRDEGFHANLAVMLKAAPVQTMVSSAIEKLYVFFVLINKTMHRGAEPQSVPPRWPPTPSSLICSKLDYEIAVTPLSSVSLVTSQTLKINADTLANRRAAREDVLKALDTLLNVWIQEDHVPEVDWMRIRTLEFQDLLRSRDRLTKSLPSEGCVRCPNFIDHYNILHGVKMLQSNITVLKMAISDQNLELIPDYEQRIDVLKELKFVDENSTVLLKGRVACEINSADELILTELILENALSNYDPEEVVALLACFVFQEKTDVEPIIPPKLEEGRGVILGIADKVGRVQDKYKVASPSTQEKLKFGLTEVVYEWAKGMPFEQITALTDIAEGTIVRVITRLDETCREVRDAARVIGDADLMKKMEDAQIKIKRDIVFAASLYF